MSISGYLSRRLSPCLFISSATIITLSELQPHEEKRDFSRHVASFLSQSLGSVPLEKPNQPNKLQTKPSGFFCRCRHCLLDSCSLFVDRHETPPHRNRKTSPAKTQCVKTDRLIFSVVSEYLRRSRGPNICSERTRQEMKGSCAGSPSLTVLTRQLTGLLVLLLFQQHVLNPDNDKTLYYTKVLSTRRLLGRPESRMSQHL